MPQKAATSRTRTIRNTMIFAAAGAVFLTTGCSAENFASMTPSISLRDGKVAATASPSASSTSAPASTKTSAPTATPKTQVTEAALPPSDLINGSLSRVHSVSDFELSTRYWSTLGMDQWTTSAVKPLTISASAQWHQKSKISAYLSSMSYVVTDQKGNVVTNGADNATISPGYDITNPFTYNTTVNLPAVKADQRVLTVNLSYDLLVQTAPKANSYYKQTVTDTMTLTLAKDAA